jgi:hypothetical protein
MLSGGTRDARRTERYLDELMAADQRRVSDFPVDVDMDPAVRLAARELRADLVRVHPSFRFEEALAARLAAGAMRLRAGLRVEVAEDGVATPGTMAAFRSHSPAVPAGPAAPVGEDGAVTAMSPAVAPIEPLAVPPASALRRLPEMAARQSRPLIMGGVGVASAAISIGAVYVAWRYSHPTSGRMGRAVRTAHGRATGSGRRRTGVINGILGVVS